MPFSACLLKQPRTTCLGMAPQILIDSTMGIMLSVHWALQFYPEMFTLWFVLSVLSFLKCSLMLKLPDQYSNYIPFSLKKKNPCFLLLLPSLNLTCLIQISTIMFSSQETVSKLLFEDSISTNSIIFFDTIFIFLVSLPTAMVLSGAQFFLPLMAFHIDFIQDLLDVHMFYASRFLQMLTVH